MASPLADRNFRRLYVNVELSFLGMFVHVVACGWLMTGLTDSAVMVALIQTAYSLPLVLCSILAGVMADTFDRRRVMLFALWLSLAASGGLWFAAIEGILTPVTILALVFAVGTGVALFGPSWQASLGDIVAREKLMEAVSLHNVGANVMRTLGPTLGGALIGTVGAGTTFFVGALAYVPALIAVLSWKSAKVRAAAPERFPQAIGAALRFVCASPHVPPVLFRVFSFSLAAVSVIALLPLIVRAQLGGTASDYGLLFGVYGIGAIFSGLSLPYLRRRFKNDHLVRLCFLINAVAILALAFSTTLIPAAFACVVAGGCWLLVHTVQNTALQLATPRWIVGRMVAMFLTAAYLGLALGGWLWGSVAQIAETRVALLASAAALVATFVLTWRMPLPPSDVTRD